MSSSIGPEGDGVKNLRIAAVACTILPAGSLAATPSSTTGAWSFDAALSRNVESMAQASACPGLLPGATLHRLEDRYLMKEVQ
jgi:hypothetical protein